MAIVKVHIRGKEISDRLTVKLLIGGICIIILLVVMGGPVLWDWIINSLVVWLGAMFFFIPLAYGFIYENFNIKYIILMAIGIIILTLYCMYSGQPAANIITSVLQSLVWMTFFSIILDKVREKIDF